MKIKLDENIPIGLVSVLIRLGHETDTVMDEGLVSESDATVWKAAQEDGRFLVTQDLDFSDIRKYRPGTHAGVMLVRLKNPSRSALLDRIGWLFAREPAESWARCVVIVTEHRVRIRRP